MKTKWEEMLFMRPHAYMHVERRERCSLYSGTSVRFVRGSLQSARWDSLFRGQLHSLHDRLGLKERSEFHRYVYCMGYGDGIQACLLSIHRFHSKIHILFTLNIFILTNLTRCQSRSSYLRQKRLCFHPCSFVNWLVCDQDYIKTEELISTKLGWKMGIVPE